MFNKNIALYVHWPFCLSKCPYCDFNSYQSQVINENDWYNAFSKQLNYSLKEFAYGFKISSIFFGGGTPSIMPVKIVANIVEQANKHGFATKNTEITLEANPRTINKDKLNSFKNAGINRLSLGVQSFLNNNLKFLKRDHEVKDTYITIENVAKVFDNFSFDIIYGLKNQTVKDLEEELSQIQNFSPKHVSAYQLTIEKNTAFYKKNIKEVGDELSIAMYNKIKQGLQKQDIFQYEVSNYAQKGFECKHNLNYWHGVPYIAIGPGACGRVIKNNNWFELMGIKNPVKYLNNVLSGKNGFTVFEEISKQSRFEEIFLSYIRLNSGIPQNILKNITPKQQQNINQLIEDNFLYLQNGNLTCTTKGMFYINSIVGYIFT